MSVFDKHRDTLERHEMMMGTARGRLATEFVGGDAAKGADWKIAAEEVAEVVVNLLRHNPRSLPSRVELSPSKPRKSYSSMEREVLSRATYVCIRQASRPPRAPRDDDGHRARPIGGSAGPSDRFARARRPARRLLPQRALPGPTKDGRRTGPRTTQRRQGVGANDNGKPQVSSFKSQVSRRRLNLEP